MTRRDLLELFILSAFWGVSFLLIKEAGHAFPPLWVALLRCALGACVLWIALKRGGHRLPPARLWRPLLLVAVCNNVIPWTFFAWGEQTVSSSIAAIVNATTPIFTLLVGLGLGASALRASQITGLGLGVLGVGLTVSGGLGEGHATAHGILILTLASLGYGVATNIAARYLGGLDPVGLATTQLSLGTLILLPLALVGPAPTAPDLRALGALALLGVFGSGLAYLLYYRLLARVAPTQVTAVTLALPVWGLGWGALAGEAVGWWSVLGVVVVLAGLGLVNRPRRAAVVGT